MAPAVVLETPLPGISQYRTQVPVKITNVQLGAPQILGSAPANGSDDSFTHDVLVKGTVNIVVIIIVLYARMQHEQK